MHRKLIYLLHLILLFTTTLAKSSERPVASISAAADEAIRKFCTKHGRTEMVSMGKRHKMRMEKLLSKHEDYFICLAISTVAHFFGKSDPYDLLISPQGLNEERRKLRALSNEVDVLKCRWGCAPFTIRIGERSFNAITVERFQGYVTLNQWLRSKSLHKDPAERKTMIYDVDFTVTYQSAIFAATRFWKAGWAHGKLNTESVLYMPGRSVKIINLKFAAQTDWKDPVAFMTHVCNDYYFFGLTFSMGLIQPDLDITGDLLHTLGSLNAFNVQQRAHARMFRLDYVEPEHIEIMTDFDRDLGKCIAYLHADMDDRSISMLPDVLQKMVPIQNPNSRPSPMLYRVKPIPKPGHRRANSEPPRLHRPPRAEVAGVLRSPIRMNLTTWGFLFFGITFIIFCSRKSSRNESIEHLLLEHEL